MVTRTAHPFVIAGGGQAGAWAAKTLRDLGYTGSLVMLAAEPHEPYERPPLSKGVLQGNQPPSSARVFSDATWHALKVDLRTGCELTRIDRASRTLEVKDIDGEISQLRFEKLLIATGARPKRLPLGEDAGVPLHYLRTLEDAEALRQSIQPGAAVLIIGGGWIGLECAASLLRMGARVVLVEPLDQLCKRSLTPAVAQHLAEVHRAAGVDLRLGTSVTRLTRDGMIRAELSDGSEVQATAILAGVGAVPNTEVAAAAGLVVDNGVVVDHHFTTSDPAIYAAGDVANCHAGPDQRHVRLESWENAQNSGIAAAHAMVGRPPPATTPPWFWSDQGELNLQLVGQTQSPRCTVVRGDPASGSFMHVYFDGARPVGAVAVNNGKDLRVMRQVISKGLAVDMATLANPDTKLNALVRTGR